ncbi:MAG: hypothetical protein KDA42_04180 [Planctomycetales bacterium]|nr:hypothetical protein [Planctomycetales bacterium]
MRNREVTPAKQSFRTLAPSRSPRFPLMLLLPAVASLLIAANFLRLHWEDSLPAKLRLTAVVVLLFTSLVQVRIAWYGWRGGDQLVPVDAIRRRLAMRWLLVGFVVSYALALLCAPPDSAPYLFAMLAAASIFCAEFPLIAPPQAFRRMLRFLSIRSVRVAGWTTYCLLLTPLAAELTLRAYSHLDSSPAQLAFVVNRCKLAPGTQLGGQVVNSHGYWDEEFVDQRSATRLRVVAIGDDLILGGDRSTNFLAQLESQHAEIEFYNLGLPAAGLREYAALVRREIASYRPDLVLAFISVGSDITEEVPLPGPFECRSLHTVQLGLVSMSHDFAEPACEQWYRWRNGLANQQSYLQRVAGRVGVCRSPIDREMQTRWEQTFGYLDQIISGCRSQDFDVALVVAPGDFQVSQNLCRTLCRRAGCPQDQIDLDLPQRRLLSYAQQTQTPVLDLLPHLARIRAAAFERNQSSLSAEGNATVAAALDHWLALQYGNLLASSLQPKLQ